MTTEIPAEFAEWSTNHYQYGQRRPFTPTEELMLEPGREFDEPLIQLQVLREAVADCIDKLSPEDQYILEAMWFEGITVRALASRLGLHKSYTHRIARRAVQRLGELAVEHPVINERVGQTTLDTPRSESAA